MVQDIGALTIFTWLWTGWRPIYNHTHVNAMARMLGEFLPIPHKVICVTDQPGGIECETYPLWDIPFEVIGINARPSMGRVQPRQERGLVHFPNSYRRLKLFSPWAAQEFPGKVMSIDLDAVITQDLSPLITPHDFRINQGVCCPYNGGMWMLRTGSRVRTWECFDQHAFRKTTHRGYVGSDQAWMAYSMPGEATWTRKEGVYHFSTAIPGEDLSGCRIMFNAGGIKPWHHQFAAKFPAMHAAYMRFL